MQWSVRIRIWIRNPTWFVQIPVVHVEDGDYIGNSYTYDNVNHPLIQTQQIPEILQEFTITQHIRFTYSCHVGHTILTEINSVYFMD